MTACAHSPGSKPLPRPADPVIERQVVTVRVCPPELSGAIGQLPPRPKMNGVGGVLEGDRATLVWVGAIARAAADLWQRLTDAQAACTAAGG